MKKTTPLMFVLPGLGVLTLGFVAKSSSDSGEDRLTEESGGEVVIVSEPSPGSNSLAGQAVRSRENDPEYIKAIAPFLSDLEAGEVLEAEKKLEEFPEGSPPGIIDMLQFALDSAREKRKISAKLKAEQGQRQLAQAMYQAEKDRRVRELDRAGEEADQMRNALHDAEDELEKVQRNSEEKLQAAVEELNEAAEAARKAAALAGESVRKTADTLLQARANSTNRGKHSSVADPDSQDGTLRIRFASNSTMVTENSFSLLDETADRLRKNPHWRLQLRGYSDSVGNPEYNNALSVARTENVKGGLLARGIPLERIETAAFGSTESPEGDSSEFRRVDLVFLPGKAGSTVPKKK